MISYISILYCNIYDVVFPLRQSEHQTASGSTYRDQNGLLVSESVHQWEELEYQVSKNKILLGRSKDMAIYYSEKLGQIKQRWRSVDDYCKHKYLNFPFSSKLFDGKTFMFVNDDAKPPVSAGLQLHENSFPYNLPDDVKHFVLWSVDEQPFEVYRKFVAERFSESDYDVIIHENSKENKSVKTIVHVHVFVRAKPKRNFLNCLKTFQTTQIILFMLSLVSAQLGIFPLPIYQFNCECH